MAKHDLILGPLLIGILFNTYLYGVVTYQFALYHKTKFNDPPIIKYMVLFLFVLDTVHSVGVMWMLWGYCVDGYDDPTILTIGLWPYTFTPIVIGLTSMATQLFLGWRIYRLSKSKVVYGIAIALSVPSFLLGITCGIKAWIIKYSDKLSEINGLSTAWLVTQVAADVFITGTLGYLFARIKTGSRRADSVINQLIRGSIQTGLFAGIFSLGDLIAFIKMPGTNLYGIFAFSISQIYTNTLLDTLLSRRAIRQQLNGTFQIDDILGVAPSTVRFAGADISTAYTSTVGNIPLDQVSARKETVVLIEEPPHGSKYSVATSV
ncbi:hypothetical protein BDY19DRAFT_520122 [Irpex rosettiformis]|uniref:Uncharacterized protein n=1 Tax=Irpex rosettiformis TaxID=378272 RepID=A0ACB8TRZ7_9APHY|nr:hypothetical protein BDY19DRAFT_520122 [Irpex rosettiformis]